MIALKSDTDAKGNANTQIVFRCQSSIDVAAVDTDAAYSWTVSGPDIDSDLSRYVSVSGRDSMLRLPPYTLTPGGTYTFQCSAHEMIRGTVVSENSHTSTLVVNAPPTSGRAPGAQPCFGT